MQYKMAFTLSQETVVSVTSPLHRLAAKEQIKMLETEEAELLSGGTVLLAKSYSDVMFCLQSYQGLMIDRSIVY